MATSGSAARRTPSLARIIAALALPAMLAACQSGGIAPRQAAVDGPTVKAPREATTPSVPPIPAAQASFRFEQILGVPTNKADVLATGLARAARDRNLTLVRRTDPTASYRVLGFLSAAGGDTGTSVTYVWDIVDAENRRLLRISGVEIASGTSADPWSGVNEETLRVIAARTVEQINAWVNQAPPAGAPPAPAAAAPLPSQAI